MNKNLLLLTIFFSILNANIFSTTEKGLNDFINPVGTNDRFVIAIYYNDNNTLSKLSLDLITRWATSFRQKNPRVDLTIAPIVSGIDSAIHPAKTICCYKNNVLLLSEIINPASIVKTDKCQKKFDDIFHFNDTNQTRGNSSEQLENEEPTRSSFEIAEDLACKNYFSRRN